MNLEIKVRIELPQTLMDVLEHLVEAYEIRPRQTIAVKPKAEPDRITRESPPEELVASPGDESVKDEPPAPEARAPRPRGRPRKNPDAPPPAPAPAEKNLPERNEVWASAKLAASISKEHNAAIREIARVIGVTRLSDIPDGDLKRFFDAVERMNAGDEWEEVLADFKASA